MCVCVGDCVPVCVCTDAICSVISGGGEAVRRLSVSRNSPCPRCCVSTEPSQPGRPSPSLAPRKPYFLYGRHSQTPPRTRRRTLLPYCPVAKLWWSHPKNPEVTSGQKHRSGSLSCRQAELSRRLARWSGEAAVIFFSTRGVINGPSSTDSVCNWLLAVASLSSLR